VRFHRVRVESRERLGSYRVLRYPWEGDVEPGQFVLIRAASQRTSFDPFLARPFSVYDLRGGVMSVLLEVRGRGTRLIASSEEIEVSAPHGRGYRPDVPAGRVALIAREGKVAPLRLLYRRLQERGVDHDIFLQLAAAQVPILRDFPGARVVDDFGDLSGYAAVYASGPGAVPPGIPCQVAVEEMMACGEGSCYGCAVPLAGGGYARACVEGPVFEARELAWI
jgi:dihydroorotate dehydrogenase electron transfer subunit